MNYRAARSRIKGAALIALAAPALGGFGCSVEGGPADPRDGGGPHWQDGGAIEPCPSGMMVRFVYLGHEGQPVPGDQRIEFPTFTIGEMTMQLHGLELIGDNAPGGNLVQRTAALQFPWTRRPQVSFPTAPPGLYSRLDYRVERTYSDEELPPGFNDQRLSIRVVGEAFLDTGVRPFEYVDDQTIEVELGLDEEVVAGMLGTAMVALDLVRWFDVVNWQTVADQQGDGSGGGGDEDGGDSDGDADADAGAGGSPLLIGLQGDQETAALMRESLRASFLVVADP